MGLVKFELFSNTNSSYTPYLAGARSGINNISSGQTLTMLGWPEDVGTREFEELGYFAIQTYDFVAGRNRSIRLNKVSWQDATGLELLWDKDLSPQLNKATVIRGARLD